MSNARHMDAAKMRRRQAKRERFIATFTQPDGTMMPRAMRRWRQQCAVSHIGRWKRDNAERIAAFRSPPGGEAMKYPADTVMVVPSAEQKRLFSALSQKVRK